MNRRGFTFGAFFASIGVAISKALGYDGTVAVPPAKPLSPPPVYEAPHAIKPHIDGPLYASVDDLKQLRDEIDAAQCLPAHEMGTALYMLWRKVDEGIKRRESFCSGHNGPALGLTAHHAMTDMGDGRRLCPYCYNKEIADGRAGGTDEGRPAS